VVAGEVDWETAQDVDDSAFHQAGFRRQAVVGIVPDTVHGEADAIDEPFVVATKQMFDVVRDLHVEKSEAVIEEEHCG
jgi:hypothetical protein